MSTMWTLSADIKRKSSPFAADLVLLAFVHEGVVDVLIGNLKAGVLVLVCLNLL